MIRTSARKLALKPRTYDDPPMSCWLARAPLVSGVTSRVARRSGHDAIPSAINRVRLSIRLSASCSPSFDRCPMDLRSARSGVLHFVEQLWKGATQKDPRGRVYSRACGGWVGVRVGRGWDVSCVLLAGARLGVHVFFCSGVSGGWVGLGGACVLSCASSISGGRRGRWAS